MDIAEVIASMRSLAAELSRDGDRRLAFHATYLRTTEAVASALRAGVFADAAWVERWDVAFADLYLDALAASRRGETVPLPWAAAFTAAADQPGLPPLRHVLLGMNAHINYDLPQALLAVITDEEFADPAVRARREADHQRIDEVLAARVRAEDTELRELSPAYGWRDRAMQPLNRLATRLFLREARAKVWANALALSQARQQGEPDYRQLLAELERRSGARVAELTRPGPVLQRLAVRGFGVVLPGAATPPHDGPARRDRDRAGRARRGRGQGGPARPGRLRSFDPVRVAALEAGAWAAYYRRRWARLLVLSVWLVHSAFGMDWVRTLHGAWLVLRANQLWAPAANDPQACQRYMRRFYALLRLAQGEPSDPAKAACLEVDWWAVHRAHRRGEDGSATPLVASLARLYAYVYRTGEAEVWVAAEHRARAMDLSDEWVAAGCPDASPLLPAVRAELVRCYAALLAAVHR